MGRGIWASTWTSKNPTPELKGKCSPHPKGTPWIGWYSDWSPSGKSPRCQALRVCGWYCSFKEQHRFFPGQATRCHGLWSEGGPHSLRRVPTDRWLWGTSFRDSDSSSLLAGCGGLTPVSRDEADRQETKDHAGLQMPLQTLLPRGDTMAATPGGQLAVGCLCSARGNPHWGLFLGVLSPPSAWIRED